MRFSFLNDEIKSIKYHGSGDLAGCIFVKNVINSLKTIEDNLAEINSDIIEIKDLYRYLWVLSFKEMVEEIDYYKIDESTKEKIKHLSQSIDYSPARFIRYINENYEVVLDKKYVTEVRWYEFYYMLMNLIYGKYSNGIKSEVFKHIEKKYALNILSHFEVYSKYYKNHKSNIQELFSGLKDTKVFDDNIYCKFLMMNNLKNDPFFMEQAKFICERSLRYIKSMNLSFNSKDILQIQRQFLGYRKLATLYELVCANEYNAYKKNLDILVDDYLKINGQSIDFGPVDFKPAIDMLKKTNDVWRFLQLTHTKTGKIISNNLNAIFDIKNTSAFSEIGNRIGEPRSDKYPYYKQDSMNINLCLNCNLLLIIFKDESLLFDFGNYLYNLSIQVEEKIFSNLIDLKHEILGIYEVLINLFAFAKEGQSDSYLFKSMINGCVLNQCGLIEKILRNIALKEAEDFTFFDSDSNTIESLFKNHNFKMISDGLLYYLEFYLSTEANESLRKGARPGKNIRNIQMHNHDDKYQKTNLTTCLELLYFIISLLGDLITMSVID